MSGFYIEVNTLRTLALCTRYVSERATTDAIMNLNGLSSSLYIRIGGTDAYLSGLRMYASSAHLIIEMICVCYYAYL